MSEDWYKLIILCLISGLITLGVMSYTSIEDKNEYIEMIEKDNIRLTDDLWVLNFKLQAENLDD